MLLCDHLLLSVGADITTSLPAAAQQSLAEHRRSQQSTAEHGRAHHSTAEHTAEHSKARQSTAKHSRAQQSTAEHSRAQQSTAEHSRAQQSTAEPSRAIRAQQSTVECSRAQQRATLYHQLPPDNSRYQHCNIRFQTALSVSPAGSGFQGFWVDLYPMFSFVFVICTL